MEDGFSSYSSLYDTSSLLQFCNGKKLTDLNLSLLVVRVVSLTTTPADWLNFTPSRAAVHACVFTCWLRAALGSLLHHGAYLNTEPWTMEKAVSGNQARLVSTDVQPWRELKVREGGSVRSSSCPDYRLTGWRGSVFRPCWLNE